MTLPAPVAAALSQSAAMPLYCLQLKLPGGDLNLSQDLFFTFDVDGEATTFIAKDSTYGTLGGVGKIISGVGNRASSVSIVLLPSTNAAYAALAAPEVQGCLARVWVATLDPVTCQVVGPPKRWFKGEVDVPSIAVSDDGKNLTMSLNSVLFTAKQADEGARLNGGFHKRGWPGEKGLDYSGNNQTDYWGAEKSKPLIDYAGALARMQQGLGVGA
jgi:hypothetical protein